MIIIFDPVTTTYIGPFADYEEAQFFAAELNGENMIIEELADPQEFYMDNSPIGAYV